MAANVATVVQQWKKFDLPKLQNALDVTAMELANKQDESDHSRKVLLDLSRDFKRNTPEDIRKAVVPLLKSFQTEVDSLSRRSKSAEAAFLALYRNLIEMPDPVPALELCHSLQQRAMRSRELEIENWHLREAVAEYKKNKNHHYHHCNGEEATIKLLREKDGNDADEVSESTLEESSSQKDLSNRLQEKEKEFLETRLEVEEKLEEALKQVAQLQSALDISQSELLDLKAKCEAESRAKCDEIELIVNDLDRANQRAALAETEVRHLKEQLAAAKQSLQLADQIQKAPDMEQAVDVVARSALEIELAAKQKEISQLVDDIQRLQSTLNTLQETSASKIAQLEDLVNQKDKMILELGEKLVKQQDYDEIKKELSLLKSMELMCSKAWAKNEGSKMEENKRQPDSGSTESSSLKVAKTEDAHGSFSSALPSSIASGGANSEFCAHPVTKEEQTSRSPTPSKSLDPAAEERKPTPTFESSPQASNAMTMTSSPEPSPTSKDAMIFTATDSSSLEKLQEILRTNIDKYANDTLNTLNISRCVRELLSVHNIGQRLFAKFVLGLSQGTVSELLSKPKPWDKLTEKGRDSYRKMHAWASDEICISMLKSLVPRRGKESGCSGTSNYKSDDQGTEERIAQILNEAQMAMMNAKQQNDKKGLSTSLSNGGSTISNVMADSRSLECSSDNRSESGEGKNSQTINRDNSTSTNGSSNSSRRSRKYENDDIPQEMVARIYQEELAKLVGQRVEESFRTPRDQYERTQEEIRQALTIYHQELTRLSHLMPQSHPNSYNHFLANGNTFASNLAQHHSSSMVPVTSSSGNHHHPHHLPPQECPVDATVGSRTRSDTKPPSRDEPEIRHHGSAFSLVRPKTEPNSTPSSTPSTLNKSSSSGSSYHLHNSSPAPPPLLPITDSTTPGSGPPGGGGGGGGTEDLSTSASPLQRMQSITNSLLSQSSVPTMPNPPQRPAKAVLPPITQHQFDQYNNLNTEEIVKKVKEQLSQYSISQRLFGESVLGLSQGSVSDLLARPKPWHMLTQKGREPFIRMKIFLEDDNAVHKLVASQYKIAPEKLMRTGGGFGNTPSTPGVLSTFGSSKMSSRNPEPNHRISEARPPPTNSTLYSSQTHTPRTSCITPDTLPISLTVNTSNSSAGSSLVCSTPSNRKPSSRGYSQPSVYEMAALTTDLDTQIVTSKIKETLMAHNIGQKIFGEVVLGLSQGSVSELLSKPKPWHMLSIKGREPFIRMQMWLNDPHNVEMLQTIKNERREANKRRRTGDGPMDSPRSSTDNQVYGYSFQPPSPYPPAKKPRVLFTDEQKEALRLAFTLDPYPSTATIEFLANELNLSVRTITNWFHNHRMRMKQHGANSDDEQRKSSDIPSPSAVGTVREGIGFDPIHYRVLLSQRLSEKFREKQGSQPFSGNYGSMPFLYSPYRNCSPLSSSGDDAGTLDLSMSSQLRNPVNSGTSKETTGSSTDDRSNSEINDDSNLSQDPAVAEVSDRDSPDENCNNRSSSAHRESPMRQPQHQQQAEAVRVPTTSSNSSGGGSSSNRRKPAMPQWVDPGLELSPDSDVHTDEEEEEDEDNDEAAGEREQIINGVCVRQTEDFDLLLPREETVHIMPVPAPDALERHQKTVLTSSRIISRFSVERSSLANRVNVPNQSATQNDSAEDLTNGNQCAKDADDDDGVDDDLRDGATSDRKKVFSDDGDESWDDAAEATDRRRNIEKLQQRLEKEDAGDDWEF